MDSNSSMQNLTTIPICAAFDIGTNTSDLIVVQKKEDGYYSVLYEEDTIIRLGESVDKNGFLLDSAMERTVSVLSIQILKAKHLGARTFRLAATSASRDASNSDVLAKKINDQFGMEFRVISGEHEAMYTFSGAFAAIDEQIGSALVFDIGGGSTEFSWGNSNRDQLDGLVSIQAGAIRISERFFSSIPPSRTELSMARKNVQELLAPLRDELISLPNLIASAGSTPAKLADVIPEDAPSSDGDLSSKRITLDTVKLWMAKVSRLDSDEILKIRNGSLRGREAYFLSGIVILDAIMETLEFESFLVSSGGVALGVALSDSW